MKFNKEEFFSQFRVFYKNKTGKPTMSAGIATSVDFLLNEFSNYPQQWKKIEHIAYAFATIAHETAWTFKPIKEYRGKTLSTQQKKYWNTGYYGRGYVQLTWDYNYKKAGQKLKVDLLGNPDLALDADIAFQILTYGMLEGWFTGKKLSTYITNTTKDYTNARRIINGTDKASLIASYALAFEKMLREAYTVETTSSVIVDTTKAELKEKEDIDTENPIEPVENPEDLTSTIDEYPDSPKPGESVSNDPAKDGEPIVGGRPTDAPIEIPKEQPKETSGWGAWVGNVRTQFATAGVGVASLGSLSFLTNPLFIKIALGFLAVAIIVSVTVWITSLIIKSIEKRGREKEAHELTMKQLEIRSNPALYNVVVTQPDK